LLDVGFVRINGPFGNHGRHWQSSTEHLQTLVRTMHDVIIVNENRFHPQVPSVTRF
jgi:hypothetical protein